MFITNVVYTPQFTLQPIQGCEASFYSCVSENLVDVQTHQ